MISFPCNSSATSSLVILMMLTHSPCRPRLWPATNLRSLLMSFLRGTKKGPSGQENIGKMIRMYNYIFSFKPYWHYWLWWSRKGCRCRNHFWASYQAQGQLRPRQPLHHCCQWAEPQAWRLPDWNDSDLWGDVWWEVLEVSIINKWHV